MKKSGGNPSKPNEVSKPDGVRRKMEPISGKEDISARRVPSKSNQSARNISTSSRSLVGVRHTATPMKNRCHTVKSTSRSADRTRAGLPVGFYKSTKSKACVKSGVRATCQSGAKLEKREVVVTTVIDDTDLRNKDDAKSSENNSGSTSSVKNSSKTSSSNLSSLKSKIGLSFSFRKSTKPQVTCNRQSKEEIIQEDPHDSSFDAQAELKEAKQEIEEKSVQISTLNSNVNKLMEKKIGLEKKVNELYDEIETLKTQNNCLTQSARPSMMLDETIGDYSLFDQSFNVACLQDQLNRMKEHNVSTTEELHATIEELKDMREKTHCLKEANRSLVSEQRMLCETLYHQSELANQYEQQVKQLEKLCESSDVNEEDYRSKLVDVVHNIEVERKKIMHDFVLLKNQYLALESELEDVKLNNDRHQEESMRWKKKFERLKKMHSGYSTRLSSLTVSDKENQMPFNLSDTSLMLSPERRTFERLADKYKTEIKRLNEVIESLKLKSSTNSNENEVALLRSEKEAALIECAFFKSQIEEERKSWATFQSDLLTAVRVADTFRQEAENETKRLSSENEKYRVEVKQLRRDVERLRRSGLGLCSSSMPVSSSVKSIVQNLEARIREFDFTSSTARETIERSKSLSRKDVPNLGKSASTDVSGNCRQILNDPLQELVRQGCGSRRNALLNWCQDRTRNYPDVEITNFSSSWADGMAFCALISSFRPDLICFDSLRACDRMSNVSRAFSTLSAVGIEHSFIAEDDITSTERPSWEKVMCLVNKIYCHFVSISAQSHDTRNENAFNVFPQTRL